MCGAYRCIFDKFSGQSVKYFNSVASFQRKGKDHPSVFGKRAARGAPCQDEQLAWIVPADSSAIYKRQLRYSDRVPVKRLSLAFADSMEKKLVLVTGASGFIATHIVQNLLQRGGYRVRGTVRNLKNEAKIKPIRQCCPEASTDLLELVEADLLDDSGWTKAVEGCHFVIHTASPFPSGEPKDPDVLVKPAVEGTLRVLKAAAEARTVKRIVLTSSVVSVHGQLEVDNDAVYDESNWTDLNCKSLEAYPKSKTMAEKAAWDFVKKPENKHLELVTICPSLVLGSIATGAKDFGTSVEAVKRLIDGSTPLVPHVALTCCDLGDTVEAHVRALEKDVAGQRIIINTKAIWMRDMGVILKKELGQYGYWIPTWTAPNIGLWFVTFVDSAAALVWPRVGKQFNFSNDKMRNLLGIEPRDINLSIIETARSLIDAGIVKKTKAYARHFDKPSNEKQ